MRVFRARRHAGQVHALDQLPRGSRQDTAGHVCTSQHSHAPAPPSVAMTTFSAQLVSGIHDHVGTLLDTPNVAMTTPALTHLPSQAIAVRDTACHNEHPPELQPPFSTRPPIGCTIKGSGGRGRKGVYSMDITRSTAGSTSAVRELPLVAAPLSAATMVGQDIAQRLCPAVPSEAPTFSGRTLDGGDVTTEGCHSKNRNCNPLRKKGSSNSSPQCLEQGFLFKIFPGPKAHRGDASNPRSSSFKSPDASFTCSQ